MGKVLYVLNTDTQMYQLVIDGIVDHGLLVQATVPVVDKLVELTDEKGLPIQVYEEN